MRLLKSCSRYRTGQDEPVITMVFRTDAALLQAFSRGHLGLLESYFDQSLDVEGDLGAALAAGMLSGLDLPRILNLKAKYDPSGRMLGLYEKCVLRA